MSPCLVEGRRKPASYLNGEHVACLLNPRLTRSTDKDSSIYRDGSSTERRIQGGARRGCLQRSRKYRPFRICAVALYLNCIIVFVLALATQLIIPLPHNMSKFASCSNLARGGRDEGQVESRVWLDAFQKITSKPCGLEACERNSWARFTVG